MFPFPCSRVKLIIVIITGRVRTGLDTKWNVTAAHDTVAITFNFDLINIDVGSTATILNIHAGDSILDDIVLQPTRSYIAADLRNLSG